jgi:RNA polymerase sigma-70 factor (ECF subfamily)
LADEAGIAHIVRTEGGRVVATLFRMTRDLDLAEDAFADASLVALERWPLDGIPERPGAWLTTVARRKALDALRRESRRRRKEDEAALVALAGDADPLPYHTVRDDQLRLIFTCSHPALAPAARSALALRVLCGLTTTEIARAFLVAEPTMGQRISRAKAKIAATGMGLRVPPDHELPARVRSVLDVINVVFTTGHHAPVGAALQRVDLTEEAIRLARVLVGLMPDEPECGGLLALLLSTHARRVTRVDTDGELVLLRDADRTQWDRDAIDEASALLHGALRVGRPGPYQVQAAISCLHSLAPDTDSTDWPQIVTLYRFLDERWPSAVVRVNRAVAEAEVHGPDRGLALLATVAGDADRWHFLHVARGDLLERAGRTDQARAAFARAIECAPNDVERRHLERRLHALSV